MILESRRLERFSTSKRPSHSAKRSFTSRPIKVTLNLSTLGSTLNLSAQRSSVEEWPISSRNAIRTSVRNTKADYDGSVFVPRLLGVLEFNGITRLVVIRIEWC